MRWRGGYGEKNNGDTTLERLNEFIKKKGYGPRDGWVVFLTL